MLRTETVTSLFRPAGFPRNREATQNEVNKYIASESNPLKQLSPLTYGSASLVAGGVTMASFFDSSMEKVLSLAGVVVGLLGLGASLLPKFNINTAREAVLAGNAGAGENTIVRRTRQFPAAVFATDEVATASKFN